MHKQQPETSKAGMSFDLESCEHSSSSGSIDDKLPSTNNLIRGKEGQYAVGRKLAQGRFGAVYEVLRKSDGKPFACKLEICGPNSHGLDMDYIVMNQAAKRGCSHLVQSIDRGKIEDHFKFLIMPLLGHNLTKIRHQFVDGRLSLSSGLRLAFLALSPIQELHNIGYVHRDIKCSNFCLAPNSSRGDTRLILVDYGVSRAYKDKTGNLKAPREQVRFRGTTRYASLNAHNGEEQAPRDDLISWFYMMVELLSGETARPLWKRMDEHVRALRNPQSYPDNPFSKHRTLRHTREPPPQLRISILHKNLADPVERKIKEALEIKHWEPPINNREEMKYAMSLITL